MKKFIYKILPISLTEKMIFTKNLAVMIKSGIALPRCFEILSCQSHHPYFKTAIIQIKQDIQKGSTLADALKKHPRIFNKFYISMIKIGEISGNLEQVLGTLAQQIKKEHQLITKVRGAMIYPALILVTLIGIGIGMLVFVVPKLFKIFADMQAELPWSTRLFLAFSSNIRIYGVYLALFCLIIFFGFYLCYRKALGKKLFHKLLLYLPFLGNTSKKINMTRFASNLSSLLESGVSLIDALKTLKGVLRNIIYSLSLEEISEKVQKGDTLSKALTSYSKLYSPLIIQMTEVGEETGTVSETLSRLAEFYQAEIDETMKNISSIIEPVLMIIIGGIVGFFALSMISPIYSIMQNV